MAELKKRIVYWWRLFRRAVYPPFAVIVGILIFLFRIPPAWVPEPLADALKKLQWLEPPWYGWTILILVAIIGALLEDAYREQIKQEEKLAKADLPSDIVVTLDGVALESIRDAENNPVPPCSSFLIRVENKGPKRLGDCQVIFGAGRAQYPVSGCFNLRPG